MLNIIRTYTLCIIYRSFGLLWHTAFFIAIYLPAHQLSAQSIGNWTFNNLLTGTAGLHNTVSSADFSASVPIRSYNGGTEYFGENGWPTGAANTAMYLQFSLSPLSGYQLDISTIVLRMRRSNTGAPAGSGPLSWSLRSSLDGFAADITNGSMTHNYADYAVTPGAAFTNIYSTITFRLYGYNTTISSGGNSRLVLDNIVVNGIGYLLPLQLGPLAATLSGEKVNLSFTAYQTATNNRYFIERSADAIHFSSLYLITEINGAAESTHGYTDDIGPFTAPGIFYYRIHSRDNDEKDSYSNIVTIRRKPVRPSIKIAIRNGCLYMDGQFAAAGNYTVQVYNAGGQLLASSYFSAAAGNNSMRLNIPARLPAVPIIKITSDKGIEQCFVTIGQ